MLAQSILVQSPAFRETRVHSHGGHINNKNDGKWKIGIMFYLEIYSECS